MCTVRATNAGPSLVEAVAFLVHPHGTRAHIYPGCALLLQVPKQGIWGTASVAGINQFLQQGQHQLGLALPRCF